MSENNNMERTRIERRVSFIEFENKWMRRFIVVIFLGFGVVFTSGGVWYVTLERVKDMKLFQVVHAAEDITAREKLKEQMVTQHELDLTIAPIQKTLDKNTEIAERIDKRSYQHTILLEKLIKASDIRGAHTQ